MKSLFIEKFMTGTKLTPVGTWIITQIQNYRYLAFWLDRQITQIQMYATLIWYSAYNNLIMCRAYVLNPKRFVEKWRIYFNSCLDITPSEWSVTTFTLSMIDGRNRNSDYSIWCRCFTIQETCFWGYILMTRNFQA